MAEDNPDTMADVAVADPTVPPIDNIHAPVEIERAQPTPQEIPLEPAQPIQQVDIDMPEAVVCLLIHVQRP